MWIFITALILVSLICLCFFKKKFWENRYLVLTISASVALVATLATNYVTRGKLDTRTEIVKTEQMQIMYLNDSLLKTDFAFTIDSEIDVTDHVHGGDTTLTGRYSPILFYYNGDDDLKIMYAIDNDFKYRYWNKTYILPSDNDTVAYFTKQRVFYDNKPNKWVADFSLPTIKTIRCLYLPPEHYATIPDSLIREIPTKFTYKIDWD